MHHYMVSFQGNQEEAAVVEQNIPAGGREWDAFKRPILNIIRDGLESLLPVRCRSRTGADPESIDFGVCSGDTEAPGAEKGKLFCLHQVWEGLGHVR